MTLAAILLGSILTGCADNVDNSPATITPGVGRVTVTAARATPTLTVGPTERSELSPTALPSLTLVTTTANGVVPTATPITVGNAKSVLSNGITECGRIPYYVPPKLDASGKPVGPIYTAIGASDTVGTGSTSPRRDSWVVQLHNKMPTAYQFVRLGIGGLTLHEANQCFLSRAIASNPNIISDWNVVNDIVRLVSVDTYKQDLDYMLQQLTSQTQAKIVVGNVPDLNSLPFVVRLAGNRYDLTQVTENWNKAIAQEVAKYPGRVYVVDLQSGMAEFKQHPEWLSGDGLHPTSAGYVQLAQYFWNVITANKLVP